MNMEMTPEEAALTHAAPPYIIFMISELPQSDQTVCKNTAFGPETHVHGRLMLLM